MAGNANFNFSSSVPVYNFGPLVTATQYKVLSAAGGTTSSVSVDTTFSANMYGATPSGDVGYCTVNYGNSVYPIVLAGPDPMGRPDLGDGSNQYTYGSEQPDGYLAVPASANAVGATSGDTAWLSPHVSLAVSPTMQTGAQPFVWTTAGSNMQVNTTVPRPYYVDPWPPGQFCYIGLPPDNSYFGNHVTTMKVDGNVSQTANYQLFYTGTASNWPNSDSIRPNWYHYYTGVYSSQEFYGDYDPNIAYPNAGYCTGAAVQSNNSPDGYDVTNLGTYLGAAAVTVPTLPVFALRTESDNLQHTTLIGELHITGIHSYLRTYLEEIGHTETFVNHQCLPPDRSAYDPAGPFAHPRVLDTDGDGVPDSLERKFGLGPNQRDSTGYYKHYTDLGLPGDNEVLAAILTLKNLLPRQNLWQQDWANPGLQFGARAPYASNPNPKIFP